MKTEQLILTFLFLSTITFGQKIISGEYDNGLKLAFESKTNKLTGYFESYSGYDEKTDAAKFSCVFYIEGTVTAGKTVIYTYYPNDEPENKIKGTFQLIDNKTASILLPEEHGGCWNVQHFADEPVKFVLEKNKAWVQIRFVMKDKAYFYSEKLMDKKLKLYVVKNDFVCVETIVNDWAYCTYFGKKVTKGWIRIADLNKIG
jgi:hypothetical protein